MNRLAFVSYVFLELNRYLITGIFIVLLSGKRISRNARTELSKITVQYDEYYRSGTS